jgi:hypothetical protein
MKDVVAAINVSHYEQSSKCSSFRLRKEAKKKRGKILLLVS